MEKIIFRTKRDFDIEYDFKKVLAVIERIKSRCQDYKIRETFGGHPANAFDGMSLPLNETETFLHDDYSIFYNAADSLLGVNKSITGEYGWDGIADIVDTHTGVGMDDHHWTLNTYQLKAEYAQLLIESINDLAKEILANYDTFLANERKREDEREAIRQSIASIDTSERTITDEGGRTKEYTHTITFHDGERLTFVERNIFDFGTVVNPSYSVVPGAEPGGLCINNEWHEFISKKGWMPVRELTENEKTALNYLKVFGGFSRSGVRM